MSDSRLIQQMALLNWLRSDTTQSKELLTLVTGAQVAQEVFNKLTGQNKVDEYKRECVLSVADFVKRNPRATQEQLNAEVGKHVKMFAARVQALESPLF